MNDDCGRTGNVSGADGGALLDVHDLVLIGLWEKFRAISGRIDEMAVSDDGMNDTILLELHRQWEHACTRAAILPASTTEARRAKASMLLHVLEVVAPASAQRAPHERLAESLAQDMLRCA